MYVCVCVCMYVCVYVCVCVCVCASVCENKPVDLSWSHYNCTSSSSQRMHYNLKSSSSHCPSFCSVLECVVPSLRFCLSLSVSPSYYVCVLVCLSLRLSVCLSDGTRRKISIRHRTGEKWKRRKLMRGGLGAPVGPQWGPGAKPLVGVWGQRSKKLKVFSVCHHKKNSILEHENQIFANQWPLCLDQTFIWPSSKLHWKCHSGAQK